LMQQTDEAREDGHQRDETDNHCGTGWEGRA
jgi:hypothetical protein